MPHADIFPVASPPARGGFIAAALVPLGLVAALAPGHAEAASAFSAVARGEISATLTLTGADILSLSLDDVDFGDDSFGVDEDGFGTGVADGSQDLILNPATASGSGFAEGSVSGTLPFGGAFSIADGFAFFDLFNSTASDLVLGITYTIMTSVDVSYDPAGPGVAGAVGFADGYVSLDSAFAGIVLDDLYESEACVATLELSDPVDCPVGPTALSVTSGVADATFSFTIAPGDDIALEFATFAFAEGLVEAVPLPAGAWLLLSGLGGFGVLRARRG